MIEKDLCKAQNQSNHSSMVEEKNFECFLGKETRIDTRPQLRVDRRDRKTRLLVVQHILLK